MRNVPYAFYSLLFVHSLFGLHIDGSQFPAFDFLHADRIAFAEEADTEIPRGVAMGGQRGQPVVGEDLDDAFVEEDAQIESFGRRQCKRDLCLPPMVSIFASGS